MEYRTLGNTGLKVSAMGLGGNTFGASVDEKTTAVIVERAMELGINFIDTADWYSRGTSEEFLGKALKGKRSRIIIATKFASKMGEGHNDSGGSRYYIMRAVEASLKRLQTDYIDLYQMHYPDPTTPIEETLRALQDLVQAGKLRYFGCSNYAPWQLCEAIWTSRLHHWSSFVTSQVRYNILERQIEKELAPCCQAYGVGIIPWGPLAGGFLTGKYRQGVPAPEGSRLSRPNTLYTVMMTIANYEILGKLEAFATARDHTLSDLAIAWLLAKPWVSTIIAGARLPEQVAANAASAGWRLTPDQLAEVEKITG